MARALRQALSTASRCGFSPNRVRQYWKRALSVAESTRLKPLPWLVIGD